MYSHAILFPVTPLPGSLNLIVTSPLKLADLHFLEYQLRDFGVI